MLTICMFRSYDSHDYYLICLRHFLPLLLRSLRQILCRILANLWHTECWRSPKFSLYDSNSSNTRSYSLSLSQEALIYHPTSHTPVLSIKCLQIPASYLDVMHDVVSIILEPLNVRSIPNCFFLNFPRIQQSVRLLHS